MSFGFSAADFITVIQLSKKVRKKFVDAPNEFNALKTEIKGLSNVLLDLEDLEDLPTARQLTHEQQSRLEDAKNGCTEVLLDLSKMSDKYSELGKASPRLDERIRRTWKRLKWEPEDVKQLRARLTSNIALLNAVSNILQNNITCHVKEGVDKLNREHDDQHCQVLADWLAPADFSNQHNDFISRRQKGTGEWLLNSREYTEWRSGTHQTLLCHGIPGAGKTTMSAIIVDDLWKHFDHHTDHAIAYAYCSYKRQNEQTLMNLVATLVRQLLQERTVSPDALQSLYKRHIHKKTRPSVEELCSLLHTVTDTYSRVFIVVDALDECTNTNGTRDSLLSELFHLQAQSKTVVCLLATTREISEILNQFGDCVKQEIRANDGDVSTYINGQISRLAPCVARRNDLQNEIKTNIIEAANGMFLLVQLHLDSLIDKTTPRAIRTAVQTMPRGVDALKHAYQATLERIQCQRPGLRDLARRVLSWITYCLRPLTVQELQHALAVQFGDAELDFENIEDEIQMVSVCAGLVTVDEESKTIRFVHYTTQEFFENIEREWLANAQLEISMSCIAYLSLDAFSSGSCSTLELFELRLKENCFLHYAATCWHRHASPVETQIVDSIYSPFLTNKGNFDSIMQVLRYEPAYFSNATRSSLKESTAVHLLARIGLPKLMNVFLNAGHHPNSKDCDEQTPLSCAAQMGQEMIVKLLLKRRDVDVNVEDIRGRTSLLWSVMGGQEMIVKLLLERDDVDMNVKNQHNQTPLLWAALRRQESIAKLLLKRDDIDVNVKDNQGRTPLSWAAAMGSEMIVKLLLERDDVDVNFKDDRGITSLSWAVKRRQDMIVRLLVERDDIDVNLKDDDGQTPLSRAVKGGQKTIVKFLLERDDTDLNLTDDDAQTPLMWALKHQEMTIAKRLWERDIIKLNSAILQLNFAGHNRNEEKK